MNFSAPFALFKRTFLPLALLYIFYFLILPKSGHWGDLNFWKLWCSHIFQNGIGRTYESGSDYLPLYHYILCFFGWLQGSLENIDRNIHLLKAITLIFDFAGGFYLLRMIYEQKGDWKDAFILSLCYFLNIGVFYNTIIWGQVDGIVSALLFISFYTAYKQQAIKALLFLLLAINFKLQAIIFIPIIGLMLLPIVITRFSLKRLMLWVGSLILLQCLILLPFILEGTTHKVWEVVTQSFGKYPVISANAYNIWYYFITGDLFTIMDNLIFCGMTCNTWGKFFFFTMSFISLAPLLKALIESIKHKHVVQLPLEKLLLTCSIIPLLFFYFNTQMHERYSHPAFIFLITYCILKKQPLIAILGITAYFLNLEAVLRFYELPNYKTFIFSPQFISSLYLLTIFLLLISLYRKEKQVSHPQ
jgi:Gpi18-like mannosyltransferase